MMGEMEGRAWSLNKKITKNFNKLVVNYKYIDSYFLNYLFFNLEQVIL